MLAVKLSVGESLKVALEKMNAAEDIRAVAVVIEDEKLVLYGAPMNCGEFNADIEKIRLSLADCNACYIFLRKTGNKMYFITFVSELTDRKVKFLYASGRHHLKTDCGMTVVDDFQISTLGELKASLFEEGCPDELMTEVERAQREIQQMVVAPQPSAMAGVGVTLSSSVVTAVDDLIQKNVAVLVLLIKDQVINLDYSDKEMANGTTISTHVPENEPRYILLRHGEESVYLIYFCPESSKLRDRMPYSSSKASFRSQLSGKGLALTKSIELAYLKELDDRIEEAEKENVALNLNSIEQKELPRGPRMVM